MRHITRDTTHVLISHTSIAIGKITRRWPFSDSATPPSFAPFSLTIGEPGIAGDDAIGFKTWGSSYLLAQNLPRLAAGPLSGLFVGEDMSCQRLGVRMLELGAGTGLLGLAAAIMWRADVVLSDLAAVAPNLAANASANSALVRQMGGSLTVGTLDWSRPNEFSVVSCERCCSTGKRDDDDDDDHHIDSIDESTEQYRLVMAADPLYDDDHPALLAGAIAAKTDFSFEDSRVVVAVPIRDSTTVRLLSDLRAAMCAQRPALVCISDDWLLGEDDWEGAEEDGTVKTWLGVFAPAKQE